MLKTPQDPFPFPPATLPLRLPEGALGGLQPQGGEVGSSRGNVLH